MEPVLMVQYLPYAGSCLVCPYWW